MKDFTIILDHGAGYSSFCFLKCYENISSNELLEKINDAAKEYSTFPNAIEWIAQKPSHSLSYGSLLNGYYQNANRADIAPDFLKLLEKRGVYKRDESDDKDRITYVDVRASDVLISAEDLELTPIKVTMKHVAYSEHEIYVPQTLSESERQQFIQRSMDKIIKKNEYLQIKDAFSTVESVDYSKERDDLSEEPELY